MSQRKNELLYSFVEQAGKAKGDEISLIRKAQNSDELVYGNKLQAFNRHAKDYVVLLPITPPPGIDFADTDSMLDTSKCSCFNGVMPGHMVVLTYPTATAGKTAAGKTAARTVMYAWGVVADRAYANDLDPGTRLRVLEDSPLDPDTLDRDHNIVDHNKMLLPVHLLGVVGDGTEVLTWEDSFMELCDTTPAITASAGFVPPASLFDAFISGIPAHDQATIDMQAKLPQEVRVFVPSLEAAINHSGHGDWDTCLYTYRALALIKACQKSANKQVQALLDCMVNTPGEAHQLPPTARSRGKVKFARLAQVLSTAASQAKTQRFRND